MADKRKHWNCTDCGRLIRRMHPKGHLGFLDKDGRPFCLGCGALRGKREKTRLVRARRAGAAATRKSKIS
jgi:hypothetical protein